MNKNISQANLPNVKLTVDTFTLTTQPHDHEYDTFEAAGVANMGGGANTVSSKTKRTKSSNIVNNTASPQTNSLGNGQALDITPSFYTAHMWLRTS